MSFLWIIFGFILSFIKFTSVFSSNLEIYIEDEVYYFPNRPILNIPNKTHSITANSSLTLKCKGQYPVRWNYTEFSDGPNNIHIHSGNNTRENEYESILHIENSTYENTGFYTCYYNGVRDLKSEENATSIYLFVNDMDNLFARSIAQFEKSSMAFIIIHQNEPGVIPCRPTFQDATVALYKAPNLLVNLSEDVSYDPRTGFHLTYPDFEFYNGDFTCNITLENITKSLPIYIFYFISDGMPQPTIDSSNAQHVVVNGSFTISCIVKINVGVMMTLEWSYPSPETILRSNQSAPISNKKHSNSYDFIEVVSNLTVYDVQLIDQGVYRCTVTNHANKSNNRDFSLKVFEDMKSFIYMSTYEEIVETNVGVDFRLLVNIDAWPTPLLIWKFNDVEIETYDSPTEKSSSLIIKNVKKSNEGIYILYGYTPNMNASQSIRLIVNEEPVLRTIGVSSFFNAGMHYAIKCYASGTPLPEINWAWQECIGETCGSNNSMWIPLHIGESHNLPNKIRIFNSVENDCPIVEKNCPVTAINIEATVSGLLKCTAKNKLGMAFDTNEFIVTDVEDGFGIESKSEIIEGDTVVLKCKANLYKFFNVWWEVMRSKMDYTYIKMDDIPGLSIHTSVSNYSKIVMLTYRNITIHDASNLRCYAQNGQDISFKTLKLVVKSIESPIFKLGHSLAGRIFTAEHAQPFALPCIVYGVPFPEITWYKDNEFFDASKKSGVTFRNRQTELYFERVVHEDHGLYTCRATNRGGTIESNGTLVVIGGMKVDASGNNRQLSSTQIGIICGIITAACVFLILLLVVGRKLIQERAQRKELQYLENLLFEQPDTGEFDPNLPLEDQVEILPYDKCWEFPKDRLKLGKVLGQGAFGRVIKGEAIGLSDSETATIVAVKMLKERADISHWKALLSELKILIHVGRHLNVVNLLGAVTKNMSKGELYVIVEYCPFGCLRQYLLQHKNHYINQIDAISGKLHLSSVCINIEPTCNGDIKKRKMEYDSGNATSLETVEPHYLTTRDLLVYSFQVARGMSYLASKKVIHRDLAARNILLSEDNVVKICDFGLAKDCYKYPDYVKKGNGPLPIKWMALESIAERIFTTQSDVWSFGVMLWEFFTLGGNPYPGIEINEIFYKKIKEGYRMEQPEYAPEEVYQIMKLCWLCNPTERPNFNKLVQLFGDLLETTTRKYYIDLNNPYLHLNKQAENEEYFNMNGSHKGYLDMNTTDNNYLHPNKELLPNSHYDNIKKTRAMDPTADEFELKPILNVPLEEEVMLTKSRSGNLENLDDDYKDSQLSVRSTPQRKFSIQHDDYDEEHFHNKEPFHKKVSNESVTSDTSSGFHSDSNYDESLNPPSYRMVMENQPTEIAA